MSEPTFAERYAAFARFNPEHVKRRLVTLAHNLAIAAALCRAWTMGAREYGYIGAWDQTWKPGCGRSAP